MIIYCLILWHLTTITFSLYLHRGVIHKSVKFNPVLQHIFRFWSWLTLGVNHKTIMGVHRIHHAFADTQQDPYSPHTNAAEFYLKKIWMTTVPVRNPQHIHFIEKFAPDANTDWIEQKVYSRWWYMGLLIFAAFHLYLFGLIGLIIAAVPFFTMSMINLVIGGLSHTIGYRHVNTDDKSHNLIPLGILFMGEEFHHNHHVRASRANFSRHWWELDLGYIYLVILSVIGLATILDKYVEGE